MCATNVSIYRDKNSKDTSLFLALFMLIVRPAVSTQNRNEGNKKRKKKIFAQSAHTRTVIRTKTISIRPTTATRTPFPIPFRYLFRCFCLKGNITGKHLSHLKKTISIMWCVREFVYCDIITPWHYTRPIHMCTYG